ncbi:QRFP-like peptide receptor [Aplysia californica]|uniref:QRFP-like peptide receptor n=1 Tax=Aplysia californica TaxID=6500 RepID=A0ABM1AAX0_APLCA|nr:QRFP-like peptide receptor [Aplysia californica]
MSFPHTPNATMSCVPGERFHPYLPDPEFFLMFSSPKKPPEYPAWEIALKILFYVLAILLDIVGNSLVIIIMFVNQRMRTTTNVLILNLAVSDFMVGISCMWIHVGAQISPEWPFGHFMCKFSTFIQVTLVTSSVLTLTVISVERFIAIVYPFRPHWSACTTGLIIAMTWLVSVTTASPHLFVRHLAEIRWSDRHEIWCAEDWPEYFKDSQCQTWKPGRIIFYSIEGIVMYFLPVVVMIVAYSVISYRLLVRKPPGTLIGSTHSAQAKAKRKVIKMLVIVLVAFVVCWTPQQILLLWDVYRPMYEELDPNVKVIKYVALYIAYLNSALNPILYSGFNENFRKGFLEGFNKCNLLKNRNRVGTATLPHEEAGRKAEDRSPNPDKAY